MNGGNVYRGKCACAHADTLLSFIHTENYMNSVIVCPRSNSLNERSARMSTWHVDSVDLSLVGEDGGPGSKSSHPIAPASGPETLRSEPLNAALREGMQLVAKAAHRVWDELYICKKPVSTCEHIYCLNKLWTLHLLFFDCLI